MFGYNVDNLNPLKALECGILLEKHGFDSIWLADHLTDIGGAGIVDPWTVGGAIAAKTKNIKVFSAVTDTQRCHPAKTAHIISNLDHLSKGRAVLGIGAGEAMNTIPFGIKYEKPIDRIARLREAIEIIKLLWTSNAEKPAIFKGKFYRLQSAYLDLLPLQKPYPPIFVGALGSDLMFKIIGEMCDGWMGWLNTPEIFKERAEKIWNYAAKVGRKFEDIQLATMLPVALSEDERVVEKGVNSFKASLLTERLTLKSAGYQPPPYPLYQNLIVSDRQEEELKNLAMKIPDDITRRCMVVGTEENCIKRIECLINAGAMHIAFIDTLSFIHSKKEMDRFERIIDYFKS